MQENPLVSLLMPVYNSPDLFRALESVRCQTYRPLQFIIIDDGSETFEEEKIRDFFSNAGDGFGLYILRNEHNLGTVCTLNRGLAIAKGKYYFNLASDDAFFDNKVLSDWVTAFEQIDCDVLTARRAICDSQLESILEILPSEKAITMIEQSTHEDLFEYLSKENHISGSCTAWRMQALRRLGLFDESYCVLEDHPAYLKLLRHGGSICFFDRTVVRYRSGGISSKHSCISPRLERDFIQMYQKEILPYVRSPFIARCRLFFWHQGVCFDRRYYLELGSANLVKRTLLQLQYYAHHPTRLIRKKTDYAGNNTVIRGVLSCRNQSSEKT